MDENMIKFTEKLNELKALARKKKNVLEITEINDFFADMDLNSDQMDKVFEYLEANNIDAELIHEAAIGKIAGDQLIKLMTLGLTEAEAEEMIISGFLK